MTTPLTPRFDRLRPASARASRAARGASRKRDTRCELVLRRELWKMGLRYRVDVRELAGRPDIVFPRQRVIVFVDGDFWHGRHFEQRVARLARGHNAPYWVAKLRANIARDIRHTEILQAGGWTVLRFWEGDLKNEHKSIAKQIAALVLERRFRSS